MKRPFFARAGGSEPAGSCLPVKSRTEGRGVRDGNERPIHREVRVFRARDEVILGEAVLRDTRDHADGDHRGCAYRRPIERIQTTSYP